MRRTRFTGAIGALALAVTLVVACSDAPTGVPPQPASAETIAQSVTLPEPPTGLCPEGYDLVLIAFLPESRQAEAKRVDGLFRLFDLEAEGRVSGLLDGWVCIKQPPPDDPDQRPIVDNRVPLEG